MPTYYVDFIVTHEEGSDPLRATTNINTDRELNTDSDEDFREIARTIYNEVKNQNPDDPAPYSVQIMNVTEDSEEVRGLMDILAKNRITVNDDIPYNL